MQRCESGASVATGKLNGKSVGVTQLLIIVANPNLVENV